MPQKGIHPLMRTMRVVMRNGASFNVQTTMNRLNPYILQAVALVLNESFKPHPCLMFQDTTTNPVYTGEAAGLSLEDERMQKMMSRYEGFVKEGEGAHVAAGTGEAPVAKAAPAAPAVKGKGKKKK